MSTNPRIRSLMARAQEVAETGRCSRLAVGCVIDHPSGHLTVAANGPLTGVCRHEDDTPCDQALHAEARAVAYAGRESGRRLRGAHVYVTHSPCAACARLLVEAGVTVVAYEHPYQDPTGLQILSEAGVKLVAF